MAAALNKCAFKCRWRTKIVHLHAVGLESVLLHMGRLKSDLLRAVQTKDAMLRLMSLAGEVHTRKQEQLALQKAPDDAQVCRSYGEFVLMGHCAESWNCYHGQSLRACPACKLARCICWLCAAQHTNLAPNDV
jgi:hypothetical protein